MPQAPLYSPFYVRWALQWSERQNLSPPELLASIGGDDAVLGDPGRRVPGHVEATLLEALQGRLGDDALLPRMAGEIGPGALDLYGLYLGASGTVAEALKRAVWAHRMLTDTHRVALKPRGSLLQVQLEAVLPQWERPGPAVLRLGALLNLVRAVGGKEQRPRWACFRMPQPGNAEAYAQLMGAPVRFSQPADELALDIACLERPGRKADPEVSRVARGHLLHLFGPHPRRQAFTELLYEELDTLLRKDEATVAAAAERLRVAPRTLQHKLQRHGMSFRVLLDARRHTFARELLAHSRLSVGSIAARLGFSDVRSLQKAFQRWESRTPQDYRRLALEPPLAAPCGD